MLDHSAVEDLGEVVAVEEPLADDLVRWVQEELAAPVEHDVGDEVPHADHHTSTTSGGTHGGDVRRSTSRAAVSVRTSGASTTTVGEAPAGIGRVGTRSDPAARRTCDTSALIDGELGIESQVGVAGVAERHPDLGDDATGPRRHHQYPVLRNTASEIEWVMNSPANCCCLEQPQRLLVEPFPGDLVDRPERLVEQHDRRLQRQRPGQRTAHSHPARQRLRVVLLESGEADEIDRPLGQPRRRSSRRKPCSSVSSSTLPRTVRHGISVGSWNT